MPTIPTFTDYGFTTVDDPFTSAPQQTQPVEVIAEPILKDMERMDKKIDQILSLIKHLDANNATKQMLSDEYRSLLKQDAQQRLQQCEQMVMPLLQNLLKDADTKEYIRWPNRRAVIETFIETFLKLTREELND